MRRWLAGLALLLSVGAALAGGGAEPAASSIAPRELAQEIRDRRPGLTVIDLRPPAAAEADPLPLARTDLPEGPINSGEIVVLYGGDAAQTAHAAAAMRARGVRDVRAVAGGPDAWRDTVLNPLLPTDRSAWTASDEDAANLSAWFGGAPRRSEDAGPPTSSRRRGC